MIAILDFFADWHPAYLWIMGAALLFIAELLIPGFVIGSFGVSATFAALAAGLGASLNVQLIVFGLAGLALVLPMRWFFTKFLMRGKEELKSGVDAMPGQRGVVVEMIDGDLHPGLVRLGGSRWSAIAEPDVKIDGGSTVHVLRVDGVKLVVAPTADAAPSEEA